MPRPYISPIVKTYETWPLANEYRLRWGADDDGQLWVAVEDPAGVCAGILPYREYLKMERSAASFTPGG